LPSIVGALTLRCSHPVLLEQGQGGLTGAGCSQESRACKNPCSWAVGWSEELPGLPSVDGLVRGPLAGAMPTSATRTDDPALRTANLAELGRGSNWQQFGVAKVWPKWLRQPVKPSCSTHHWFTHSRSLAQSIPPTSSGSCQHTIGSLVLLKSHPARVNGCHVDPHFLAFLH
jgi:hypothetical protein